ncbi:MAG: phosphodiesterase [Xanthobacteraceae bacterium]|nr:phosphodiesterase [Xanthobacteraceae bacterium]MBX3522069.1 phosphodiesterase [Xanthobacteraceae bacterium]MBX3535664.1 phosphodiesterase [Xanthobacteraceae bacterium]MBX3548463.1 phosphodiesterase [Xanthobacteraceae bacterium]MCW5674025.1 phosphodiesterase [Xanthobacteraceae bacterium]
MRAEPERTPVLIVQISDMHVSVPGKLFGRHIDSRASFERAITRVLALDPKPDLVVLSGDLAETGAGQEYDFIAAQIARLPCPALAIPGNHDLREEMLRKLPRNVQGQDGGHLSFAEDGFPLRVIGLDTIVPGEVHGEICEHRLAWLRGVLAKDSSKPAMIAMHHPPFTTGFVAMDNYGIKRGLGEFRAIIAEHAAKISAIVCGHVHRSIIGNLSGVPVVIAPATSFPFKLALGEKPSLRFIAEPPQFMVHKWSRDAGFVSHVAFVDEFPGPYPLS